MSIGNNGNQDNFFSNNNNDVENANNVHNINIVIPIEVLASDFKTYFFMNNLRFSQLMLNLANDFKDLVLNELSNTNFYNKSASLIDILFQINISKQLFEFENPNYVFNENEFKEQIKFLFRNNYRLKPQEVYLDDNTNFNVIIIQDRVQNNSPINDYLNNCIQRKLLYKISSKKIEINSKTMKTIIPTLYEDSKKEVEKCFSQLKNIFNQERLIFINTNEMNLNIERGGRV